jgi:ankyrin repeat protein
VTTTASGLAGIHLKIGELLLAHGADVEARTGWGWTALDTAERSNTTYIVDLLRRHHGQEDDR